MVIAGYVVFQLTGSTFETQLVGVASTAPMLLLGVASGFIADSFQRRHVLIAIHLVNIVLAGVVATLLLAGLIESWHLLALTAGFGVSNALDMTARRAFVSDVVTSPALPFALALETLSMTSSAMIGPWIGGALVDYVPLGDTGAAGPYLFMMAAYAVGALLLFMRVTSSGRQHPGPLNLGSAVESITQGLRAIAGNRVVVGTLGITIMWNLFFASYQPLLPVFAAEVLQVSPALLGLLGGAQGAGALLGSMFIATRRSIGHRSRYYIFGTLLSLASLFVFSLSSVFPLSFAALLVAGVGFAGFATMQATLVLVSVEEEMRGRAMGVVSMAIGGLPLGMLGVGALAELVGPGTAVTITSSTGFVGVCLWSWRARAMRRV